jgi:hypothetical protein
MNALIEQLEDLLARSAGARPDKAAVDAGSYLLANGSSAEQLSPDIAVGDRSDHAAAGILGKQDAEHVDVEPSKRFLDRFGLSDGNERAIQQFLGSKGLDPASVEG